MTSADIQQALYRYFHNYDYKLSNSYIYNVSGECDFFGMSKSGYQMEVEIKVSRSDFFVDFKKEKHKYYQAIFDKKTHLVINEGGPHRYCPCQESIYGSYEYFIPRYPNFRYGRIYNNEGRIQQQEHDQMLRNWPGVILEKHKGLLYGDYTRIGIKVLEKILIPHKMYYAVPNGLIKASEVPEYAGLIETDGNVFEETKKAPYLHKRKQDINHVLLNKFYYECMDWRSGRKQLKSA